MTPTDSHLVKIHLVRAVVSMVFLSYLGECAEDKPTQQVYNKAYKSVLICTRSYNVF